MCAIDGCGDLVSSHGLCKRHAERQRRGTLEKRLIVNIPGEVWAAIEGHPGWSVSTAGRVKSDRRGHERLLKPRMVDGRMLVTGHSPGEGNVTIHLAVLRAFRPGESGDSVFIDGDRTNCRLENLRWETIADRRSAAIAMAERSVNKWSGAFVGFWSGDRTALDGFFEEMRRLLIVVVPRKIASYSLGYQADVDDVIYSTLARVSLSINSATLRSLDNLTAYVCTVADRYLAEHWRYANSLQPMYGQSPECEDVNVLDVVGWHSPSAELEAIYREEQHARPKEPVRVD